MNQRRYNDEGVFFMTSSVLFKHCKSQYGTESSGMGDLHVNVFDGVGLGRP